MAAWAERQKQPAKVNQLRCAECGYVSGLYAIGWRGYRTDDPEVQEPPTVAFFCPTCAAREFNAE